MKKDESHSPTETARKRTEKKEDHYVLRLYVAGLSPRSSSAIRNLRAFCESHLKAHYELEIVDICEHPGLARGEQVVAAPTLVKQLPLPLRRLIGDMSDESKVLIGLDLKTRTDTG